MAPADPTPPTKDGAPAPAVAAPAAKPAEGVPPAAAAKPAADAAAADKAPPKRFRLALPATRGGRVALGSGLAGAALVVVGLVAWPKGGADASSDDAAENAATDSDAPTSRAASRRAAALDLLAASPDEIAAATEPSSRPESAPVAADAAEPTGAEPKVSEPTAAEPTAADLLTAPLEPPAAAPAKAAGLDTRPTGDLPPALAAAEAAYGRGDYETARRESLRFLAAPGPFESDVALLGRAHFRLSLSLAGLARLESGLDDAGVPEPKIEFTERRR